MTWVLSTGVALTDGLGHRRLQRIVDVGVNDDIGVNEDRGHTTPRVAR